LLEGSQASHSKKWPIIYPDSYESNPLIFMVNIPVWSWTRGLSEIRS
jgi:hypothetical protein